MQFIKLLFIWVYKGYTKKYPKIKDAEVYGILVLTSLLSLNILTVINLFQYKLNKLEISITLIVTYLIIYFFVSKLIIEEVENYQLSLIKKRYLSFYVFGTILFFIFSFQII